MWLLGGLNPNEIHKRLKADNDFQKNFFEFFEDSIHHHLPNIDIELDPKFEPRIERPPVPPSALDKTLEVMDEWDDVFVTEIKKCGESVQRHHHRKVCEKYSP